MTNTVQQQTQQEEIEDPVERMLKKTGCIELHYQVQVSSLDNPQN